MASENIDFDHELNNGWSKWQNLVLQGLKDNSENQKELASAVQDIKIDMALVKAQTTQMHSTLTDQGGEIKVLQDAKTYMSGLWKAGVLLTASSVAIIGVITGLIQAGLI